jgi:hypothetical protein
LIKVVQLGKNGCLVLIQRYTDNVSLLRLDFSCVCGPAQIPSQCVSRIAGLIFRPYGMSRLSERDGRQM